MIHKTDLLDPTSVDHLSDYEKNVLDGAQNAGNSPRFINVEKITRSNHAGALQQFLNPRAIRAAECDAPGCDSDISDGISNLKEAVDFDRS